MKIAICDDEPIFQALIKTEIEKYYNSLDVLIGTFSDGEALVSDMKRNTYDMIFLDVEMAGMDGFETARTIRGMQPDVTIIYLTSHTELAMEGYEVQAFRFLSKPLDRRKMHAALDAYERLVQQQKKIMIVEDGIQKYISCQRIRYIKSENVYLQIVTQDGEHWVRKKMKELLNELPQNMFVAVHRSYIVNMCYIKSFSGNVLLLDDETKIPVSKGNREYFKQQMMHYMRERG